MHIQGAMTALVTPFKDGKLDTQGYEKLIRHQIENSIDAVVPVGTTGESATLTHNEHKECIEIAVSTCKGTSTKVIAGAGSNATHESVDLARFAQESGADGILCVSPYYNKPTQQGLYEHYKSIANAVDVDVVMYNVPGRTASNILPQTAIRLFEACKNIVAIKEASGNLGAVVHLHAHCPDLSIISGEDAINYPIMASGGSGCISVTSNLVPKKIADLIHLAQDGDFVASRKINEDLYDLNTALFVESNPIPIKFAMYVTGLLSHLEYRLPLTMPSKENQKIIEQTIKRYI